ncbi:hypothetical protein [Kovacikia minuta]|nr:hypothetical protein [Kovacikia minuta]
MNEQQYHPRNGSNQRRQTTLNSAPAALVRPLRWGCWDADRT